MIAEFFSLLLKDDDGRHPTHRKVGNRVEDVIVEQARNQGSRFDSSGI
jgi:hypothetical protein